MEQQESNQVKNNNFPTTQQTSNENIWGGKDTTTKPPQTTPKNELQNLRTCDGKKLYKKQNQIPNMNSISK